MPILARNEKNIRLTDYFQVSIYKAHEIQDLQLSVDVPILAKIEKDMINRLLSTINRLGLLYTGYQPHPPRRSLPRQAYEI